MNQQFMPPPPYAPQQVSPQQISPQQDSQAQYQPPQQYAPPPQQQYAPTQQYQPPQQYAPPPPPQQYQPVTPMKRDNGRQIGGTPYVSWPQVVPGTVFEGTFLRFERGGKHNSRIIILACSDGVQRGLFSTGKLDYLFKEGEVVPGNYVVIQYLGRIKLGEKSRYAGRESSDHGLQVIDDLDRSTQPEFASAVQMVRAEYDRARMGNQQAPAPYPPPAYGQPQYPQQGYGAPQYPQQGYGAPQYAPPQYAPPPPPQYAPPPPPQGPGVAAPWAPPPRNSNENW